MALIKVKDLQEALRLIKQVIEMLDKIYHAVTDEKNK
jgi:NADH:ubiquinone oxidoreductase subunit D